MKKWTLFAISFLLLTGCASTNLPPVTSPEFLGMEEDEKRIWNRSAEEQEKLHGSGLVYADKELDSYLAGIGRKLLPAEIHKKVPFRFKVLMVPYSNAFAFPDGAIYIHSGMLAMMENEAQLATVMAHEMVHSTHRHQVREFRGTRNKASVLASVQSTLGTLPAVGGLASTLGDIGAMAAVTGYSRGLETESDMEGIRLVVEAGYDPREAPKLFQHLKEELDEDGGKEPFFFGSHPRLNDRISNFEDFLETYQGNQGVTNTEVFRKKTAGVVLENAYLELEAGRFEKARRGAEKYVSIRPKDAKGYCLLGEIARQKGEKEDLVQAKKNLEKAIALDPSFADSYKYLGMIHFKEGARAQAGKAFNSYLKKAPKAADRTFVEQYLAQCK